MKKYLTKHLVMWIALTACTASASGQDMQRPTSSLEVDYEAGMLIMKPQMELPGSKAKVLRTTSKGVTPGIFGDTKARPRQIKAASEEKTVTLNLQMAEHDDIFDYLPFVFMFNNDPAFDNLAYGENEVPAGVYNFVTEFWKLGSNGIAQPYYVVKEGVEVKEDMTLTFDVDEAKNYVQIDHRAQSGRTLDQPAYYLNSSSGQWEFLEGDESYSKATLIYEGYGEFFGLGASYYDACHFYISDLSSNFSYSAGVVFYDEGMVQVVNHHFKGIHEDMTLVNDPEDFVVNEETFKLSPVNASTSRPPYPIVSIYHDKMGSIVMYYPVEIADGKIKYCIDKTKMDAQCPTFVTFGIADYVWESIMDFGDGDVYTEINQSACTSLPIFNVDGQLRYCSNGCLSYNYVNRDYDIDGELKKFDLWPGNPAFSFELSKRKESMLGNSCPIACVELNKYPAYEGQASVDVWAHYYGRYGEERLSDGITATATMTDDGETVFDDVLGAFCTFGIFDYNYDHGVFDITLTNTNVDVDGLPGKNLTLIHADKTLPECCPPTLSMLHFRNADDMVTDRFAQAADGTLEFYANDLNFVVSEDWAYSWTIGQNEVKVSYAPYATDNWQSLTVKEDPQKFYLPALGNYYSAPLSVVEGQARDCWFDLKIRLTDAVGNWQEQIISPAFRIDELVATGIEDVKDGSADSWKRFYSLDGKQQNQPKQGGNVVKTSDGLVRKIMVK